MEWLEGATALGTIGAAFFAWRSASAAARSAKSSTAIVDLEASRDRAGRVARAQGVTVDLQTERHGEWDYLHARIVNSSTSPFLRSRVRITADSGEWGPQLVGALLPGEDLEIICRLPPLADVNAHVRFYDPEGDAWIASSTGGVVRATDSVEEWIQAGRVFATSVSRPFDQGWISRERPRFDEFRQMMEEVEAENTGD